MLVGALEGLRSHTFGSPDFFWDVSVPNERTSATFYECAPRVNIPPRSISIWTHTKMAKIAILEMADLAALQPWDRSGVHTESILAGLECRRTIRAVQTRFPDSWTCKSRLRNFLIRVSVLIRLGWSGRCTALRSFRGAHWEYPSWSGVSQRYLWVSDCLKCQNEV